jgi:hypothetical protein
VKIGTLQLPVAAAFAAGLIITITIFTFAFIIGVATGSRSADAAPPRAFATLTPESLPAVPIDTSPAATPSETSGVPALPDVVDVTTVTPPPVAPTFTPVPVIPTVTRVPPTSTPIPTLPPPTATAVPPTAVPPTPVPPTDVPPTDVPPTEAPAPTEPPAVAPPTAAPPPEALPSDAGLSAAISVVQLHGYNVVDTSTYYPPGPLHVLIGSKPGTAHNMWAFVFNGDVWLGTDTDTPSAGITVTAQTPDSVTLTYVLYHPNDPICCPTAGTGSTLYKLINGRFRPQGPIPADSPQAPTSRR